MSPRPVRFLHHICISPYTCWDCALPTLFCVSRMFFICFFLKLWIRKLYELTTLGLNFRGARIWRLWQVWEIWLSMNSDRNKGLKTPIVQEKCSDQGFLSLDRRGGGSVLAWIFCLILQRCEIISFIFWVGVPVDSEVWFLYQSVLLICVCICYFPHEMRGGGIGTQKTQLRHPFTCKMEIMNYIECI